MSQFDPTTDCCQPTNRRTFFKSSALKTTALGFGHLALSSLLQETAQANPLAEKQTNHFARAKRVIFLFMKGGPSGVDTFDYKPQLQKDDGKELPFDKPRVQFGQTGKLMKSPWKFRPYGENGVMVSELFHMSPSASTTCVFSTVSMGRMQPMEAFLKTAYRK